MEGVSSFTVYIVSVGLKGIRIGVAEAGYDQMKKIGRDERSFAVHSNGKAYHNNKDSPFAAKIKAKSTITVTLNRQEGSLSYAVDGFDYGRAFTNIKLERMELFPAV